MSLQDGRTFKEEVDEAIAERWGREKVKWIDRLEVFKVRLRDRYGLESELTVLAENPTQAAEIAEIVRRADRPSGKRGWKWSCVTNVAEDDVWAMRAALRARGRPARGAVGGVGQACAP
jgi:hypothetical protein